MAKKVMRGRELLAKLGIPQKKSDAAIAVIANAIYRSNRFSEFDCIPVCGHSVSKSELFQKIEEAMLKDGGLSCL